MCGWALAFPHPAFRRPVPQRERRAKHQRVHVFTHHAIHHPSRLQQRTLRLRLARGDMPGEAELLEELLGEELRDSGDFLAAAADFLIPFEGGFMRAVEDEERVDVEG